MLSPGTSKGNTSQVVNLRGFGDLEPNRPVGCSLQSDHRGTFSLALTWTLPSNLT
jgi:hypothetical protein